ncbi:hypothetical protein GRF59_06245 [Paenibacillus sp. HJL G12]|uniref:Uncharacterized protein n=1 Tax=Paenibacillus dendrobii TaxID=2691084 RepID=A0A7X3IFZ7_9BACL|nr:hypothetical protein [Paenibacillus dendrobii]MWV43227.1 hypothetical protein [Paenibacillus dendrobii]
MSAKSWMSYLSLLFGCICLVIFVDLHTLTPMNSMHSDPTNIGRLLLYPGWSMLAALLLFTFVFAVRYFDALEDYIAKLSYHSLVPFLSSCTLLLSFFLQLRKLKHTLTSLRTDAESMPVFDSIGLVNAYTASLFFNAHIVLFWLSFSILAGWWVVQKRKN